MYMFLDCLSFLVCEIIIIIFFPFISWGLSIMFTEKDDFGWFLFYYYFCVNIISWINYFCYFKAVVLILFLIIIIIFWETFTSLSIKSLFLNKDWKLICNSLLLWRDLWLIGRCLLLQQAFFIYEPKRISHSFLINKSFEPLCCFTLSIHHGMLSLYALISVRNFIFNLEKLFSVHLFPKI